MVQPSKALLFIIVKFSDNDVNAKFLQSLKDFRKKLDEFKKDLKDLEDYERELKEHKQKGKEEIK